MNLDLPRWIKLAPFTSLNALHDEHLELRHEAEAAEECCAKGQPTCRRDVVLLRRRIRRFEERAAATGQILDERTDRDLVQSMLDYWSIRQAYLARESERLRIAEAGDGASRLTARRPPPLSEPLCLAPFDEDQAPALPDEPSPFVGLNAFTEMETANAFFHGRADAVRELANVVARNRLVVVTGPSGGGKSSLVMAGLVPALREGALPGSAHWAYWPAIMPGTDPFAALLNVVRPPNQDVRNWISEQRANLESSPISLAQICEHAAEGPRPSLLVIDQTEEVLTITREEDVRERFLTAMVSVTQSESPEHRLIVIVREDFLAHLRRVKPFADLTDDVVVTYRPKPMTAEELRQAIEEPARAVGLKFDAGIVDDLVRCVVNDPAALPLLQFTLTQLWRRRRRNRITHDIYEKIGRPAEALERTADNVYEKLGAQENQEAARHIFLALVVPAASANEPSDVSADSQIVNSEWVRRRLPRAVLHELQASDRIDRVLDAFVKEGLIRKTSGTDTDEDRFDVSHEALLRNWRRLREWLFEKRSNSQRELQVLTNARQWHQSNGNADHLAVGSALEEAEKYTADPLIRQYVEASRKAAKQREGRLLKRIYALSTAVVLLLIGGSALAAYLTYNYNRKTVELAKKSEEQALERAQLQAELARRARVDQTTIQSELLPAATGPVTAMTDESAIVAGGPGATGYLWVGSSETPLLREASGRVVANPASVRPGQGYRLRVNVVLRKGWPQQNPFKPADRISRDAAAIAGSLLVAREVKAFQKNGSTQYWMQARLVPELFVQYPPGSKRQIGNIISKLREHGYEVAAPEESETAIGKSEIRYYHTQDSETASKLKGLLEDILDKRVRATDESEPEPGQEKSEHKDDPGKLELWLDPQPESSIKRSPSSATSE